MQTDNCYLTLCHDDGTQLAKRALAGKLQSILMRGFLEWTAHTIGSPREI